MLQKRMLIHIKFLNAIFICSSIIFFLKNDIEGFAISYGVSSFLICYLISSGNINPRMNYTITCDERDLYSFEKEFSSIRNMGIVDRLKRDFFRGAFEYVSIFVSIISIFYLYNLSYVLVLVFGNAAIHATDYFMAKRLIKTRSR